jgi:hypothetical protein
VRFWRASWPIAVRVGALTLYGALVLAVLAGGRDR